MITVHEAILNPNFGNMLCSRHFHADHAMVARIDVFVMLADAVMADPIPLFTRNQAGDELVLDVWLAPTDDNAILRGSILLSLAADEGIMICIDSGTEEITVGPADGYDSYLCIEELV